LTNPRFPELILNSIKKGTELIKSSKELSEDPRKERIIKKIIHLQVSMLKWDKFEGYEQLRF
jgi:hypothetical protein